MCFIRVNTKHQPLKPPGAAPTLTNVYDRSILDTSVDIANPTTKEIVASLNVAEELQVKRRQDSKPVPLREISAEEVTEKTKGKRREGMPKGRRAGRDSTSDAEKGTKGGKAMNEIAAERQRSLGILADIQGG